MKNLFDPATAAELTDRLTRLRADSPRQWGKMNAAQAAAHCAASLETAVGDSRPPRMFVGRLLGGLVKRKVVGDDAPLARNTPTAPGLVMADERDMERERKRLHALIARFSSAGPTACTTHPHTFFGPLTPDEWSILMYKHLDHHLRQFGA